MKGLVTSLWVGLGGFLGANARYWLGGWVAQRWGTEFPWGTVLINVTGSFILGLFATVTTERFQVPSQLRLLVAIGFVGAYTTFSTFEYETLKLVESGSVGRALANLLGSVLVGFTAVFLGARLGRLI